MNSRESTSLIHRSFIDPSFDSGSFSQPNKSRSTTPQHLLYLGQADRPTTRQVYTRLSSSRSSSSSRNSFNIASRHFIHKKLSAPTTISVATTFLVHSLVQNTVPPFHLCFISSYHINIYTITVNWRSMTIVYVLQIYLSYPHSLYEFACNVVVVFSWLA